MNQTSLLVIIPDHLSALVAKGEVTPRYYNPGNLFDEVHILLVNDDKPDVQALQPTAGRARLTLHNLPIPPGRFFHKTLGWRPRLLRPWAQGGVRLAQSIRPDMVRCHGTGLVGVVAGEIKRSLGIPYIVSLHTRPDDNRKNWTSGWKNKVFAHAMRSAERFSVENADHVLAVYRSLLPYLEKFNTANVSVAYNVLNEHYTIKDDYSLHDPLRLISVGNLMRGKCPDNVIRALPGISAHLTLVGHGEKQPYLKSVAQQAGVEDRVTFIPSMPNREVCGILRDYDAFVTHCSYPGIPKAVMEPMLTGLPVVINRPENGPVPEYDETHMILVDNSPQGYASAIRALQSDPALRHRIGAAGREYALRTFEPSAAENTVAGVYRTIMQRGRP